ncbi:hypothetical protein BDQ17DRAFT_1546949 [Cyathus striatus]|nr:hypothetical protein BDQ17DRAFT_1546949 [Cyathus striatus]
MFTTSNNMNGSFSGAHNFQIFSATFTDDSASKKDKMRALYNVCAHAAIFDSKERSSISKCLEGTAQSSLSRIRNWGDRVNGSLMLWLCGPVGTGKFTISQIMAEEWASQERAISQASAL